MKILAAGNIEITVVLMPDAYAALMAIVERDKLTKVNAINLAVLMLENVSQAAAAAGTPVGEMMAGHG